MRRYETTFVINPDLGEEEIHATINKFTRIVDAQGGFLVKQDEWGRRRLAYKIGKYIHGYYVLIDFAGEGGALTELERNLKLDDRIIRFLSVKIGDQVNLEALQAELAAKAKPQEETEPAPASAETAEAPPSEPTQESTEPEA